MVGVEKNGDCLFYSGVSTKDKEFKEILETTDDMEDAIYIMECAAGKRRDGQMDYKTTPRS